MSIGNKALQTSINLNTFLKPCFKSRVLGSDRKKIACTNGRKMSFLRRLAGLSLRDRVRSSVIRRELGVDPLLLETSQHYFYCK